jgi:hypothetical protein
LGRFRDTDKSLNIQYGREDIGHVLLRFIDGGMLDRVAFPSGRNRHAFVDGTCLFTA